MSKYSIGIDFGTQSVRGIVVDVNNGNEIKTAVSLYKNGLFEIEMPWKEKLKNGQSLMNPIDYKDSLFECLDFLLSNIDIDKSDIIGIGVDSHCSSSFPVDKDYNPLSLNPKYKENKDAYVKMWKHHSAKKYADEINEYDRLHGNKINRIYGNKASSEWFFPKLIETFVSSYDLYNDAYNFIEVGDYAIYLLSNDYKRSEVIIKCKYHYDSGEYLIDSFIKDKYPLMSNYKDKLPGEIKKVGEVSSVLSKEIAMKYGLKAGIPIATLNSDALVNPVSFGVFSEKSVVSVIGTSMCDIINRSDFKLVDGSCGTIYNVSLPKYYSYESGQNAVGDILSSFIKLYSKELEEYDDPFEYLNTEAMKLSPLESGLVSLDFFNGNRNILNDSNLTGLVLGLTLNTNFIEIYRSLIESICFGYKKIMDNYVSQGVEIEKILACGGIPKKNNLFNQLLSDITGKEVLVSKTKYSAALSSAIYGAYASKYYSSIFEASNKMGGIDEIKFVPNINNHEKYMKLYNVYQALYDSKELRNLMKILLEEKEKC